MQFNTKYTKLKTMNTKKYIIGGLFIGFSFELFVLSCIWI